MDAASRPVRRRLTVEHSRLDCGDPDQNGRCSCQGPPEPTDLERVLDLLERAETQLTAYEQGADTWSETVRRIWRDIRDELAKWGK